jgi:hypothetical protein
MCKPNSLSKGLFCKSIQKLCYQKIFKMALASEKAARMDKIEPKLIF